MVLGRDGEGNDCVVDDFWDIRNDTHEFWRLLSQHDPIELITNPSSLIPPMRTGTGQSRQPPSKNPSILLPLPKEDSRWVVPRKQINHHHNIITNHLPHSNQPTSHLTLPILLPQHPASSHTKA